MPRGTGSNANGQRGQSNNFMVDGIDNNESWINSTILQPSVEATEEFKIYTNPPAEFGRASGGTVNVQIRSGSNEVHGSVYDYLRNSSLDARLFQQDCAEPAPHPRIPTSSNDPRVPIRETTGSFSGTTEAAPGRGLNVIPSFDRRPEPAISAPLPSTIR